MAASPSARFPLAPAHRRYRAARCRRDRRVRRADHHDPGQRQRHRRAGARRRRRVCWSPRRRPRRRPNRPWRARRRTRPEWRRPPPSSRARRATARRSAPRPPRRPRGHRRPSAALPPSRHLRRRRLRRPAAAPGGSSRVAREPLRVYNNSLIQGLAARAAADFRSAGWTVAEIGGYPGAAIPTSTVYYRPGTDEQTAAQEIGRAFGLRVEPRFSGIQSASPGRDRHRDEGVPVARQVVSRTPARRPTPPVGIAHGLRSA